MMDDERLVACTAVLDGCKEGGLSEAPSAALAILPSYGPHEEAATGPMHQGAKECSPTHRGRRRELNGRTERFLKDCARP
jgi:hypothetical protein